MNPFRKKPRQQRALTTWNSILDASAQLFGQLGYAATTTNKIAERAGVSIGSLYQYFPHKDALLQALTERHLAEAGEVLSAVFRELNQKQPGLETTVDRLIEVTFQLHRQDPETHRLLFDLTPRTVERMQRFRQLEQLLAGAVAQQLVRLGVGGGNAQLRALLMVQALEAQVHGAVLEPVAKTSSAEVVDAVKGMWQTVLARWHCDDGSLDQSLDKSPDQIRLDRANRGRAI